MAEDKKPDPYFDLIMDEDLANNKWPKGLDEVKSKGTQCIAINAISKENFDKYKDIKTEKAGWTIARSINSGVINPSSFLGRRSCSCCWSSSPRPIWHELSKKVSDVRSSQWMQMVLVKERQCGLWYYFWWSLAAP